MRLALKMLATILSIVLSTALILLIFSDVQILPLEEQQTLKQGKYFWKWSSPYGPLSIHYVEKGMGSKHILLLHGFRGHTYTWRNLIDPLALAGYHVWAIDLLGYGLSDKPGNVVYNVDFFQEQVLAFMESHHFSKAHLVGNSMGGGLALCIATEHPECVNSLILLSALGYPLDLPLYLSITRHISSLWNPLLGPNLAPKMVRYCLEQLMFNTDLITEEQVSAYSLPYRLPNGITSPLLTLQQWDNQRLTKMSSCYPSLKSPTLIIWGDRDNSIPLSHYEKFLMDFPEADHLLIPNCGHLPQEEAPKEVLNSILSFLKKHKN